MLYFAKWVGDYKPEWALWRIVIKVKIEVKDGGGILVRLGKGIRFVC